jgi:hypothetical protein
VLFFSLDNSMNNNNHHHHQGKFRFFFIFKTIGFLLDDENGEVIASMTKVNEGGKFIFNLEYTY